MTKPETEEIQRLRTAAQGLVERGWFVLPIISKSKKPFHSASGWNEINNLNALESKWAEEITANFGVACGPSNLTVLDIDAGFVDLAHAQRWAEQNKVNTLMVQTGRADSAGIHFYFQGTRKGAKYKNGDVSGEIKSLGAYVVGPGSRHENDNLYTIVSDVPLAPLPEWLQNYDGTKQRKPRKKSMTEAGSATTGGQAPACTGPNDHLNYGEEYPEQKVHALQRHWFLLKKARYLREIGLEQDTILLALRDLCLSRCNDGEKYYQKEMEKLKRMAEDVCKQPIGKTLSKKGPRPRPEFELQLDLRLPQGSTCDRKVLLSQLRTDGFYFGTPSDRLALHRARKALGVLVTQEGGVTTYSRKPAQNPVEPQRVPEEGIELPIEASVSY